MEKRTLQFDSDLGIEAYQFAGIIQKFPKHFHEHYVIGFVEAGCRSLICKNIEYTVKAGDLLLFNPHDSHACEQIDGKTLDWRCLNIEKDLMCCVAREITRDEQPPIFTTTVASQSEALAALKHLHSSIMEGDRDFDKEETFYFLIEQLICDYTQPVAAMPLQVGREVAAACDYMEKNYATTINLSDLSEVAGLNKYALLRNFTMQKGITPYQYLSTIRVNNAKKLLEAGVPPIEAALRCGFADQSHCTRFFKNFIGLTPKRYQSLFNTDDKER